MQPTNEFKTMSKITIKTIRLRNFKGTKSLEVNFNDGETTITGDNETGKTTVFDAFNFLLWQKNSANEKQFGIKTLDKDNNAFPKLEHEVSGIILNNGAEVELKVIYKEKWTKRRGSETMEMTGHDTSYFVNEVPKSASEYAQVINTIIPAEFARMITDPMYFNTHLKWEQRRAILTGIAGEITDDDVFDKIATPQNDYGEVINIINSDKSLEDKKKEIAVKKSKIKDEISVIPSRIDEVDRMKPAVKDWESIENEISGLEKEKDSVQVKIDDQSAAYQKDFDKVSAKIQEKNNLTLKIQQEENRLKTEANTERLRIIQQNSEKEQDILAKKSLIVQYSGSVASNSNEIDLIRLRNDSLKEEWTKLNATPVTSEDRPNEDCPTCGQALPQQEIEARWNEITQRANADRASKMKELADKATLNNAVIKGKKNVIESENSAISELKAEIEGIQILPVPEEKEPVSAELTELKEKLKAMPDVFETQGKASTQDLKIKILELQRKIDVLKIELSGKQTIEKSDKRIKELTDEQRRLSQELAGMEKIEMQIDQFNKAKIEMVENRVNSLFSLVKFKMFENQIKGGEAPTCVCMINGVPFSDLNTAGKIQAGIDIIATLQKHFEYVAPVFIDNRESVSEIPAIECQIINLVVVKGQKTLKVA